MPKLKFLELKCYNTEDTGGDEAYLTVNGNRVWAIDKISSGESASLRSVNPIPFKNSVEVALWDEDTGLFDSDDNLGKCTISASVAGQDEQDYRFKGDGSDYLLVYKVLPD